MLGRHVDLRREAGGVRHDRLDRREDVELLVGAEAHHPLLELLGGVEQLALHDDHLRVLVHLAHERGHVDHHSERGDPDDVVAQTLPVPEDALVVAEDLLVLRHPAVDLGVGDGVHREVPRETHAAAVVGDGRLHRLVHDRGEGAAEVHAIGRVGVAQQLERVAVDFFAIRLERAAEHLAGRLGAALVDLRLRLDRQALERAEHLEPRLAVVLVDDRDDLVVACAERLDEVLCHGRIAVVHREVDQDDLAVVPGRHGELVHRESLAEDDLDFGVAVEAQCRGGREHAVHRAHGNHEVEGGESRNGTRRHDDLPRCLHRVSVEKNR